MAIRTEPASAVPGGPAAHGTAGYGSGRERPVGGFELWSWLFMRLSGVVLLVLAVGHVLIMHVLDGGVGRVDFKFVQLRWGSPFWRTWDWMMLSLALVHGINGLRVVVMDYVRPAPARFVINMLFYLIGFGLFALGTIIVFTFDPSAFPST